MSKKKRNSGIKVSVTLAVPGWIITTVVTAVMLHWR
jgi:NhaP-type Na+/H+ or K+/H+ antiporter